jgi:UrcA family protein
MNSFFSTHRTLSLTLACTGLITAANLAVAEQITEEIIVRAPAQRVIDVTPVGSSVKIENVEIDQFVSIADLDLSTSADVEELDMRIEAVAKESCQKLDDMYPFDHTSLMEMNTCIKKAVASASERRGTAISVGH